MKRSALLSGIISAALACALCVVPAGNAEAAEDSVTESYSITSYWTEYRDFADDKIGYLKEAGLDTATVYSIPWGDMSDGAVHYEHLTQTVDKLQKLGLRASVNDGRLTQTIQPEGSTANATEDGIKNGMKRIRNEWPEESLKAVSEFFLFDEPSTRDFQALNWAQKALREYFPDKTGYINLLPSYASPQQLGCESYEDYVDSFVKTVRPDYLCVDYYSFLEQGNRIGLAENLEILKHASEKYAADGKKIPIRIILQCSSEKGAYRSPTLSELSWQANMAILYSAKQLSWYSYSHPSGAPGSGDEILDANSQPTEHFEMLKTINKENRALGNAVYQTMSDKVFCTGAPVEGLETYESYGALGALSDAGNLLLGFYDDTDLLFVMSSESGGDKLQNFAAKTLDVYRWLNPKSKSWESLDTCPQYATGKLALSAGEGVLLRRDQGLADAKEAAEKAEKEAAEKAAAEQAAKEQAAKEQAEKAAAEKAAAEKAAEEAKKTVTVNVSKVTASAVAKAVKKAGSSSKKVTTIVLGSKVKAVSKNALAKYGKVKTVVVKTKKLTKKSVKGCLGKSKVKTVTVAVSAKKATNKTYAAKYKKIFTKKNCGKSVKVIR